MQACSLLPGNWKMLNRHSSTADFGSLEDFLLSTMRKKAPTYWPFCHAHLRLQSHLHNFTTVEPTCNPWVFQHTVPLKLSQPRKERFAAFFPKKKDWFYWDTWILISDIFNFFSPPAAFEDDAISVRVSAAAATNRYWYVLMSVIFRW